MREMGKNAPQKHKFQYISSIIKNSPEEYFPQQNFPLPAWDAGIRATVVFLKSKAGVSLHILKYISDL